ncbi:hypothetical protein T492DRAFT_908363 [Pavlovales sp. CCMP2436]|nr:hypothetical protein T492DRAFT_908363 [Pavlovales sp. CCMP2436]
MSAWNTLDRKDRSSKKIKTTSLVDALARAGGSREALRADNDLRACNHESTGRPAEQRASDVARGIHAAVDKAYVWEGG